MHTKFKMENVKGTIHLVDPGIHGKVVLKWILKKEVIGVRSG
jgi:hypothetical protein